MKTQTKLLIGLAVLALLSPLGLILPEKLKAGAAWGEWGPEELKGLVGYMPEGLGKLSSLWSAMIPDYAFKGWEEKGLGHLSLSYVASALIGIGLCIALGALLGKVLKKKEK
jgi:cobalt/nickel transport protein